MATTLKHKVLYIPGLGDHRLKMRQRGLNTWRYKNIKPVIVPKRWSVSEDWEHKLQRLTERIDTYVAEGYTVSLIGESAGASAVMEALSVREDKIHKVILLCGKTQYPQRVSSYLYDRNPALKGAMQGSHRAVNDLSESQKQKILNLHPLFDPVVPVQETKITGVRDATMPVGGHFLGIAFGITFWSWRIVKFIRKGK